MMGSRKFFVLSMALALALVGSGTALGQICTASSSGATVRAEGITELTSDIRLQCFSGSSLLVENYKLVIDVNDGVQITNTIDSSDTKIASDITLTFDDPAGGTNDKTDTGKIVGPSSVEFVLDRQAFTTAQTLIGRISGIRVNASAGGSLITASLSDNDAGFLREQVTIGRRVVGLKTKRQGDPVEGAACTNSVGISSGTLDTNKNIYTAAIRVEEGFATAFKADNGNSRKTRLMLSFADIPAGVRVWLRPGNTTRSNEINGSGDAQTCDPALRLHLLTGLDSNGFGVGEAISIGDAADEDDNFVEVSLSNGSGKAFYEVQLNQDDPDNDPATASTTSDTTTEKCDIPVTFTWKSASVGLGTGTMSASFAPVSSGFTASVEDNFLPRFVRTGSAVEAITIEDCSTTLLFPFVTNQVSHDTGIVISNTSMDAFGTTAHEGSCMIHYYGSMVGGGAAPSAMRTDSIAGGAQEVFMLSSKAPGFQGYLMARCGFQFGHGLAFITNGAGGSPTYAQGYLALVVPVSHGDRGVDGGAAEQLSN